METIIASVIAGVTAIVGSFIVYQYNIRKIVDNTNEISENKDKMLEEHSNLSKEHNDLSKEHNDLSKEHNQIILYQNDIKDNTRKINDMLIESKTKSEMAMVHLTDT